MLRLAGTILTTAALAAAQPPIPARGEPMTLAVDPDVGLAITDFARLAEAMLGRSVKITEFANSPAGSVKWSDPLKVRRENFAIVFEAMVHRLGYVCRDAENGKGLELVPMEPGATRVEQRAEARFAWPHELAQHAEHADRAVLTVVAMQRTNAQATAERTRDTAPESDGGQIGSTRRGVVIQGAAPWVAEVARIAKHLDVPDEAPAQEVAKGFRFVEGPAWDPLRNVLLFSDIPANKIHELNADGEVSTYLEPSGGANGLIFDRKGNLYACQGGARRVVRITPARKTEVLAERFADKLLNSPNDLARDSDGGVYFTDPRYGNTDGLEQEVMGVYYIAADGTVTRVIDTQARPNGIVVSLDGKMLFVAEPNHAKILAYGITGPGKLTKPRTFFESSKHVDGGGPDGMAVDENGYLYATYGSVLVLDTAGELVRRIEIPQRPSNCTFGGVDRNVLYVTARTGLYRKKLTVRGAPVR